MGKMGISNFRIFVFFPSLFLGGNGRACAAIRKWEANWFASGLEVEQNKEWPTHRFPPNKDFHFPKFRNLNTLQFHQKYIISDDYKSRY